jgi:hypothetical protein
MRNGSLILLLLALFGCSTTIISPHRMGEMDAKEVAAVEAAFNQAMLAGSAEQLESLLDATFIRTFRDGSQQTREDAIDEVRSGRLRFASLESSDVTIHVYAHAAVIRGTSLRQRSAVPGAEADTQPFQLFYTMTLIKTDQSWKIVALHASH